MFAVEGVQIEVNQHFDDKQIVVYQNLDYWHVFDYENHLIHHFQKIFRQRDSLISPEQVFPHYLCTLDKLIFAWTNLWGSPYGKHAHIQAYKCYHSVRIMPSILSNFLIYYFVHIFMYEDLRELATFILYVFFGWLKIQLP